MAGCATPKASSETGLPAYHRRPSSPPSGIVHQPVDLNLPIACGGVAVYPGDIIVGDCDGVVVIPPDIVDAVAEEALATTLYDEFAEEEVARGRSLVGLFPGAGEEAKRDFEAWKGKAPARISSGPPRREQKELAFSDPGVA